MRVLASSMTPFCLFGFWVDSVELIQHEPKPQPESEPYRFFSWKSDKALENQDQIFL